MKLKLISDGFVTKIVNAETGEEVEGVQSILLRHSRSDEDGTVLIIEVLGVETDGMVTGSTTDAEKPS